ncbi:DUF883 family protein [Bartonella krasnovii]|uniref:DUF883 C-terminal domain-containing protein n=1 Tax=Bartonella krasnovii TaxID=2267275 RepID=A0A5B9D2I1_9HYPH|nr:DUF883 C-terminal domain-containing protein [Bartonella krasnovii]QEE12766.1 DUF883 domain-containing protein [Bartonella krasnovii]UNF28882.1 DUF883 C-terminal domain-containing protein [Bartonella krasnovii]UNF35248.1 DUF883 C-terminal domain-containing protein [Bartonella krasnovii]UNF36876.1 DUF883 C-terminal domain-containing protein [Bartonella krasnovii]UNF38562.1 DUF883 C-terminal domain-containing protein [Bartonella krasnovii]
MDNNKNTKKNKTTAEKDPQNELQGQLETLRHEISGMTSTLTDLGTKKFNAAKDKAEKLYHSAKESGEDIMAQAKDKISDLEQTMNQCVRKNPGKSVLFAAGVGFILSQLLRR